LRRSASGAFRRVLDRSRQGVDAADGMRDAHGNRARPFRPAQLPVGFGEIDEPRVGLRTLWKESLRHLGKGGRGFRTIVSLRSPLAGPAPPWVIAAPPTVLRNLPADAVVLARVVSVQRFGRGWHATASARAVLAGAVDRRP
jgi:hypothetical protein